MLKIKNKLFQPVQVPLRSADHRSLETVVIPARSELVVEEDLSTAMVDSLVSRGWVAVERITK